METSSVQITATSNNTVFGICTVSRIYKIPTELEITISLQWGLYCTRVAIINLEMATFHWTKLRTDSCLSWSVPTVIMIGWSSQWHVNLCCKQYLTFSWKGCHVEDSLPIPFSLSAWTSPGQVDQLSLLTKCWQHRPCPLNPVPIMESLLWQMGSSEVKCFRSSHFIGVILTGVWRPRSPPKGSCTTWWSDKAILRPQKLAPATYTLWMAHRTPTAQLIAARSKGRGRDWRKAVGNPQVRLLRHKRITLIFIHSHNFIYGLYPDDP